jgi:4-amino-4-deoxy-L-arabinose transferase-like glycosyltransferase
MKKDVLHPDFPAKKWLRQDRLYLGALSLTGIILLFTGLSVRSLWGSEGRWAEIVREMFLSGNYFLPTINGLVYFDKPLLSYWAIIPFVINGIVTETAARMPGALAGIGAVIITFLIGRRLFESKIGFISSLLLLTSVMFILWSRTASAEMLNLFAIWLSYWFFISGAYQGSFIYVILLYSTCAVASFCKGPVAPAVVFSSIIFYSVFETIIQARKNAFTLTAVKDAFLSKFRWIISWQGFFGVLGGAAIFVILLLMPVIFTGSWSSVELMWKENVQRFFRPFDHIEPLYIYFKHIPVFFAPWTLLMLSSLLGIIYWEKNMPERLITLLTLAIFLFFTISGSRRSYYILPILPGLALITGKGITDWLSNDKQSRQRVARLAAISTCSILILFGMGIIYAYFNKIIPSHFSQLAIGVFAIAAGIISFILFYKNIPKKGLTILILIVFIVELWGFTVGMALAEKNRTLRPFALKAADYLKNVSNDKISLFQGYDSAFVFYLKRGPLRGLNTIEEIKSFQKTHTDGFLIADLSSIIKFQQAGRLDGISVIIAEKLDPKKHDDNLALFSFSR